ncbi:MAG: hypothetical protein EAZ57_08805 [Cytophagales bacterium]|nr:MAG: hypothetical protein EAZ67_09615 [Cytophagales bacterium]TAF60125.1 MAG: hypothetical protein EAZ57_08805 [Cytophagales bacterium]
MTIKTKKFQLEHNTYIKFCLRLVAAEWWWAWLIPIGVFLLFLATDLLWWGVGVSITLYLLYAVFWVAQFVGITRHERFKMLFDRYSYEIDNMQILMRISREKGMAVPWAKIKRAYKEKEGFLLVMSLAQIIYLPYKSFGNEQDVRLFENQLNRKNLLESFTFKGIFASKKTKLTF